MNNPVESEQVPGSSTVWSAEAYLGNDRVAERTIRGRSKRGLAISFINTSLSKLRVEHGPDVPIRGLIRQVTYTLPAGGQVPDRKVDSWSNGVPIEEYATVDADGAVSWTATTPPDGSADTARTTGDVLAPARRPDGRILVRGVDGMQAVLPGAIDGEARDVYRHSQGSALALALSEQSGWPVGLVRTSRPAARLLRDTVGRLYQSAEPVDWMCAVVVTPDGDCLDIDGRRQPAAVCEAIEQDYPDHGPYRVEPLTVDQQAAWVREIHQYAPRSVTEWVTAWVFAVALLAADHG